MLLQQGKLVLPFKKNPEVLVDPLEPASIE